MPYTVKINGFDVVCDSYESLMAVVSKTEQSKPEEVYPHQETKRHMKLTDLTLLVLSDNTGKFFTTEEVSFIIKRKHSNQYPQPIKERSVSGILSSLKSRGLITSKTSGCRMVYGINKD